MDRYKKTWQDWWMALDHKPKGKDKHLVGKITRSKIKEDTKKEIREYYKEDKDRL